MLKHCSLSLHVCWGTTRMNGQVQKKNQLHTFFPTFWSSYSHSWKYALPSFNTSMALLMKAAREISLLKLTSCFQNKESFLVNHLHVPKDCCLELQESMVFLQRKFSSARTAEVKLIPSVSTEISGSAQGLPLNVPSPWSCRRASGCAARPARRMGGSPGPQKHPWGWSPAQYQRNSCTPPVREQNSLGREQLYSFALKWHNVMSWSWSPRHEDWAVYAQFLAKRLINPASRKSPVKRQTNLTDLQAVACAL